MWRTEERGTASMAMNIDELFQHIQLNADTNNVQFPSIPKTWSQGRTVFGGLSASLALLAIRQLVGDERVLRSISVNFVGPIAAESEFTITPSLLREGRNVTHATATITQGDKICVVCNACFGSGRESRIKVANQVHNDMVHPKKANFIPQIPKVVPKFLRHFDLSIEKGMPFTGSKNKQVEGWMRFKEAPREISDAHIIAMIDAWPPTLLQMLRLPAPASTVTWEVEFIHPIKSLQPTGWLAYKADTRQAADGYGHTEANIWNDSGELVALSRQVVGIFD